VLLQEVVHRRLGLGRLGREQGGEEELLLLAVVALVSEGLEEVEERRDPLLRNGLAGVDPDGERLEDGERPLDNHVLLSEILGGRSRRPVVMMVVHMAHLFLLSFIRARAPRAVATPVPSRKFTPPDFLARSES